MKRKKNNFKDFVCILLLALAACTNETSVTPSASHVLDLNNFTYNEVATLLKDGKSVILKDSNQQISVTKFSIIYDASLSIPEQAVDLYEVSGNDSISATLCSKFVSIRVRKSGNEIGYIAYAVPEDMTEVTAQYSKRQNAKAVISGLEDGKNNNSLRIDIALLKQNYLNSLTKEGISSTQCKVATEIPIIQEQAKANYAPALVAYSRNKIVTIYLLQNEKYTNGQFPSIPHELVWAEEDARKSIADIFKDDKSNAPTLKFITQTCDFKSTSNGSSDLSKFATYVSGNSLKFPTGGKDIYLFVRNCSWISDGVAGISCPDTYSINREVNKVAYGLSSTSCFNGTTVLAHELGHIFGAIHSTTPWYKINIDLMNANVVPWIKPYHRTDIDQGSKNRDLIFNNLKQK